MDNVAFSVKNNRQKTLVALNILQGFYSKKGDASIDCSYNDNSRASIIFYSELTRLSINLADFSSITFWLRAERDVIVKIRLCPLFRKSKVVCKFRRSRGQIIRQTCLFIGCKNYMAFGSRQKVIAQHFCLQLTVHVSSQIKCSDIV